MTRSSILAVALCIATSGAFAQQQATPPPPLGFFVATEVPGSGNLGGLEGADQICQSLATIAGAGERTWRAYLSTQGDNAVNARDRIGKGPWANANGVIIAANVEDLHGDIERDRNYLMKFTVLDQNGNEILGFGDDPVQHDILTGSDSHGMAVTGDVDRTCGNWSSDVDVEGAGPAIGHSDRRGLPNRGNTSWNAAHNAFGCSVDGLKRFGGAGFFYCFAAD